MTVFILPSERPAFAEDPEGGSVPVFTGGVGRSGDVGAAEGGEEVADGAAGGEGDPAVVLVGLEAERDLLNGAAVGGAVGLHDREGECRALVEGAQ